jgi:hypothetical protein
MHVNFEFIAIFSPPWDEGSGDQPSFVGLSLDTRTGLESYSVDFSVGSVGDLLPDCRWHRWTHNRRTPDEIYDMQFRYTIHIDSRTFKESRRGMRQTQARTK